MKNFEIACEMALGDWIDGIEELQKVEYSENHIKKINSIAGGKHVFNVYVTKTLFHVLVAAVIIFSLSIVGFAVKEAVESKKILNLHGNMFEVEHPQNSPVTSLEYGYIPEGFILDTNQNEYEKRYEEKQRYIYRHFYTADGNRLTIAKHDEGASFYDPPSDFIKMTRFTEGGINYLLSQYMEKNGDELIVNDNFSDLRWHADGKIYWIYGDVSVEEALKIAREMR